MDLPLLDLGLSIIETTPDISDEAAFATRPSQLKCDSYLPRFISRAFSVEIRARAVEASTCAPGAAEFSTKLVESSGGRALPRFTPCGSMARAKGVDAEALVFSFVAGAAKLQRAFWTVGPS